MNDHLNIPKDIQSIINEIENVDLNFAELPMPEHSKLPQFNRTIRVLDIDFKSKQEFIVFVYEQVLRDKETGEEIKIALPSPEWAVYKETCSSFRADNNKAIRLPLTADNSKTDILQVPSYKYMLWLMKSKKVCFLQLIETYLESFIKAKQIDLDQL